MFTTLFDNISLLPSPYEEEQNIVILRVTEKEIEEVSLDTVHIKKQSKRRR